MAERSSCTGAEATAALTPLLEGALADLVFREPRRLHELVREHGSPLNLLWPDRLKHNVGRLRTVLDGCGVRHEIFYGAKVNKSPALVRAAVEAGAGVDVSSLYELRDALRVGADPTRICASGPAKTRTFLEELIGHGALISVDSAEELQDLEVLACAGGRLRVLLRYQPAGSRGSRFGMNAPALAASLQRLAAHRQGFEFLGFHFHLSGYACKDRIQAVLELSDFIAAARGLGLVPRILDIGGGLPVRYVDGDGYETFLAEQGPAHYHNGHVPQTFYPYGGRVDAQTWLEHFLQARACDGESIAQFLAGEDLTLAIEPGRSLADQTAISLFKVTRVKALRKGRAVIFVEGSSFSACETWFASEFLVDPLIVPAEPARSAPGDEFRGYIAGHSCLEEDVLTNRLVRFPFTPRPGDLLVYANTAGYQMDLLENEFHRYPMPRRLRLVADASGGFAAISDHLESSGS